MSRFERPTPTGREIPWSDDEIIVSKTDPKGIITYANSVFLRLAGYREEELIGKPHNIIRHPDMPKCVFKLLWDTLKDGREIFAYVKNMARSGDHYWVFAHVTPTFGADGRIVGYHSNRRTPDRRVVPFFEDLYAQLLAEERRHANPAAAMDASARLLAAALEKRAMEYDEFVFSV